MLTRSYPSVTLVSSATGSTPGSSSKAPSVSALSLPLLQLTTTGSATSARRPAFLLGPERVQRLPQHLRRALQPLTLGGVHVRDDGLSRPVAPDDRRQREGDVA